MREIHGYHHGWIARERSDEENKEKKGEVCQGYEI